MAISHGEAKAMILEAGSLDPPSVHGGTSCHPVVLYPVTITTRLLRTAGSNTVAIAACSSRICQVFNAQNCKYSDVLQKTSTKEAIALIQIGVCLTTSPQPLPKRVLHKSAIVPSSCNLQYTVLLYKSVNKHNNIFK